MKLRSMTRKPPLGHHDALELLLRDHQVIKQLFSDYRRLTRREADDGCRADVVSQLCFWLSMHVQIEEEIFYPALRGAAGRGAPALPDECDHVAVKELIAKLDELEPGDPDYDTTIAELSGCVVPHMEAEQAEIFPRVRMAGLDTAALGRQMTQRLKALNEDVTRIGLPNCTPDAATWPADCRIVMA